MLKDLSMANRTTMRTHLYFNLLVYMYFAYDLYDSFISWRFQRFFSNVNGHTVGGTDPPIEMRGRI